MVEVIPERLWMDIYLVSDGGGDLPNKKVVSKINQIPLTGTENINWYDFVNRGRVVGKRLPLYSEWTAAALGSPQGLDASNLHGWTKTSNTARIKTAATNAADADANYILGYNTSLLGLRDCVGNVWEWTGDMSNRQDATSWGWQDVLDTGELSVQIEPGQAYLPNNYGVVSYLAGGIWNSGVRAGSRAVGVDHYPWYMNSYVGARFACESV